MPDAPRVVDNVFSHVVEFQPTILYHAPTGYAAALARSDFGQYDLSSLEIVVSSGVMWSHDVKQGLLKHHGRMALADMFGSSEAVGFGSSVTTASPARSPVRRAAHCSSRAQTS